MWSWSKNDHRRIKIWSRPLKIKINRCDQLWFLNVAHAKRFKNTQSHTLNYIITHIFLFYVTIITFKNHSKVPFRTSYSATLIFCSVLFLTSSHSSLVTALCGTSRHRWYPLVSLTNALTLPSSIPAPLVPCMSAMDAKGLLTRWCNKKRSLGIFKYKNQRNWLFALV